MEDMDDNFDFSTHVMNEPKKKTVPVKEEVK